MYKFCRFPFKNHFSADRTASQVVIVFKNKKTEHRRFSYGTVFRFYCCYLFIFSYYSLLKATTGSFLAALLEGMIPDTRVSITLIKTSITAATGGKNAVRL